MSQTDLNSAVDEYLNREDAANARPEGADHAELLETVAHEHGLTTARLTRAVLDHTPRPV